MADFRIRGDSSGFDSVTSSPGPSLTEDSTHCPGCRDEVPSPGLCRDCLLADYDAELDARVAARVAEGRALEGERKAYLGIETVGGGLTEVEAVHPSHCKCGAMLRQRTGSSTNTNPKDILWGPWTCLGCGEAIPQSGDEKEGA